jgi:hypothetical protein
MANKSNSRCSKKWKDTVSLDTVYQSSVYGVVRLTEMWKDKSKSRGGLNPFYLRNSRQVKGGLYVRK